jgi:hypothetical protein
MNDSSRFDKKPRGATRSKYFSLFLFVVFGFIAPSSSTPLNTFLLTGYCALAIALAAACIKVMWTQNTTRASPWVAWPLILGGAAVVVGLLILDDKNIFVWSQWYLVLPLWIFFGLTAIAAWFVEWRKAVLIYEVIGGFAFVRPPAPPITLANRVALGVGMVIVIWGVFVFNHDERLDDGFNEFYFPVRPAVPDAENAAFAIAGLTAPSGTDFVAFGRSASDIWWSGISAGAARARIESNGKLDFVGTNDELNCWDDVAPSNDVSKCATDARVLELVQQNAEMLSRYRKAFQLSYPYSPTYNGTTEISLNKLIANEIRLDLRQGRGEAAYQKWRDNQAFLRRALASEGTWVSKAIDLVLESISLSTADYLIRTAPQVANAHYVEMKELLNANGLEGYNIDGVMRAEYLLLDPI